MTASRSRLCERAGAACVPAGASLVSGDMGSTVMHVCRERSAAAEPVTRCLRANSGEMADVAGARDLLHSVTSCSRQTRRPQIGCGDDDPGGRVAALRARVGAALRQPRDHSERATRRAIGERPLDLTPREFQLLLALAERRNRVVPRADLYELVWRRRMAYRDRSVDVFVRKLRLKLQRRGAGLGLHPHPLRHRLPVRAAAAAVARSVRASSSQPGHNVPPARATSKAVLLVPR